MITQQHAQELLSRAYASVIASIAGVNLVLGREFDYSVDGEFRTVVNENGNLIEDGFTLDFQLKSTVQWSENEDTIIYPCKSNAYNKLVSRATAPRPPCMLILFCMPRDPSAWVDINVERLLLRKCCYWTYIRETTLVPADSTKTVYIPKENLLTPDTVREHLDIIKSGGRPS
jgi:hypothetical protein